MARILLVDDDAELSELLQESLREQGHDVQWQDLPDEALEVLCGGEVFDVVLLDNMMPRMSGIDVLTRLKERGIKLPVILFTSAPGDRSAIEATRQGAFNYIVKPDRFEDMMAALNPTLTEALEIASRPRHVPIPNLCRPIQNEDASIVGRSRPIIEVFRQIGQVADSDAEVLIRGETGTGKDLVARAIHTNSKRKEGPFVVVNCTALNENMLESELFGHERGAFSGADKLRKGRFEHAEGGTLFLDEIGDISENVQIKLLRVLQEKTIERVGSCEPIKVNVRVLAATHKDFGILVQEQKFREDLYHRLQGYLITLPPLRERKEDIDLLVMHFLRPLMQENVSDFVHPDALALLRNHTWKGNIRELQQVLRRAIQSCRGYQILPRDIHFEELLNGSTRTKPEETDETVESLLRRAAQLAWEEGEPKLLPRLTAILEGELLRVAQDRKLQDQLKDDELARQLGMSRTTMWKKLKDLDLQLIPK